MRVGRTVRVQVVVHALQLGEFGVGGARSVGLLCVLILLLLFPEILLEVVIKAFADHF